MLDKAELILYFGKINLIGKLIMATISELKANLATLQQETQVNQLAKVTADQTIKELPDRIAATKKNLENLLDSPLGQFLEVVYLQKKLFNGLERFKVDKVVTSPHGAIFPVYLSAEVMAIKVLENSPKHLRESHLHRDNSIENDRNSRATLSNLNSFNLVSDPNAYKINDILIEEIARNGLPQLIESARSHLTETVEMIVEQGAEFDNLTPDEQAKVGIYARFFAPDAKLKLAPESNYIAAFAENFTRLCLDEKSLATSRDTLTKATAHLEAIPAGITAINLQLALQGAVMQKLLATAIAANADKPTPVKQPQ